MVRLASDIPDQYTRGTARATPAHALVEADSTAGLAPVLGSPEQEEQRGTAAAG
jgi:hypothetical protein